MKPPPSNLTDEALVLCSLQGDRSSVEELLRRHRDFIYNLSLKMTWDREDAADITQEVLIKVITKLEGFRKDSSFTTWLYRITVNHILNERKAAAGTRKLTFVQFGATLDNALDSSLTADEQYRADAPPADRRDQTNLYVRYADLPG